jgi:hypothetical protein
MGYSRKYFKSKKRGGYTLPNTVNYGSAANWMLDTVGNGNTQYNNVFSQNSPFPGTHGNAIVGLQGQVAGKKYKKTKRRRGGNLSQVINKAVVPFGLLALQQSYRKKKGGKKGKRTRRKR